MALLMVGVLAIAVVIFDHRGSDRIADGVKVGAIDVGGLTPAQAKAKVQRELLGPLSAPIVVRYGDETWRLTAQRAKVRANVGGMVDEAVAASRSGNILQRAWREATGGSVEKTVDAPVSYSRRAVNRFVAGIAGDVDQEPKDARITFAVRNLGEVAGREGVKLNAAGLQRRIKRAVATPGAARTFTATTSTVEPKTTTADLAERYPVVLTVDRKNFKLRLFKGLKLTKTYDVRVGQQGLETPAGIYHIQNKVVDPAWNVPYSDWTGDLAGKVIPGGTPENPLKARWMGIFDGAGIHGIDPSQYGTIGTAASHGCVGMRIPDVEDLYDQVPVHTPIYIA